MIHYTSTRATTDQRFLFPEALRLGLAPDGGLFMPDSIPRLTQQEIVSLKGLSNAETGKLLLKPWLGSYLEEPALNALIEDALDFPSPLVPLGDNTYILELFHGPTLAFKDFAARTMGRLMAQLLREEGKQLHVLTATSGDTGAAVADGFLGVEGITVWVLYPSGKVSPLQEKQFTTLGNNVKAIEVQGTFDDCQKLVKQAFTDTELRSGMQLTSANSINIGRLLPQMVYYAQAVGQLQEMGFDTTDTGKPVFVVPSGNFGNLTAGLLAQQMGIPAHHFVAATNENRTFYDFIKSGTYDARVSVRTISNAMDVGDPSNFDRVYSLLGKSHAQVRTHITPYWIDDKQTGQTITNVYEQYGYIMDPHTAVAYRAWRQQQQAMNTDPGHPGIILATAHPAKFMEVMPVGVSKHITLPPALEKLKTREKKATFIQADYAAFKAELLKFL